MSSSFEQQMEAMYEMDPEEARKKFERLEVVNPKEGAGAQKVPFSCIPCQPLGELAVAMYEGGYKYGKHNYRDSRIAASTYYEAILRHMMDFWEGEDIDPDSGLSHITKAIATLFVFRDAMMSEQWYDDRPVRGMQDWQAHANNLLAETKARLEGKQKQKPHLEIDRAVDVPPSE